MSIRHIRTLTISKEGEPAVYCPKIGAGLSVHHMMQMLSAVVDDPAIVSEFIQCFVESANGHPWEEYGSLVENWAAITQLFLQDLAQEPNEMAIDAITDLLPVMLFAMFLGMSLGISLEISKIDASPTVQ